MAIRGAGTGVVEGRRLWRMPLFDRELENRPLDPSEEFSKQYNHFFLAQELAEFDLRSASGKIRWEGFSLEQRVSYHQVTLPFAQGKSW
jgi:hypothetical protein